MSAVLIGINHPALLSLFLSYPVGLEKMELIITYKYDSDDGEYEEKLVLCLAASRSIIR